MILPPAGWKAPPEKKAPPAHDQGQARIESEAAVNLPFTADICKVFEIVSRARRYAPEPRAVIVYQDLREEPA